jgi:hypothetical protein
MKALAEIGQRSRSWTWTMDKEGATLRKRDGSKSWIWTMDKEGATLRKRDGSKFLNKRSTQVGGASS